MLARVFGPEKKYIHVIPNFLNNVDLLNAESLLLKRDKMPWRDNPNVNIIPHMYVDAHLYMSDKSYRVTESIKDLFNIEDDLFVIDTQMGTWNNNSATSGDHYDTYGMEYTEFSSIIYLTSDYEGGEIVFPELGFTYKPKAGDLIVFPSHGYLHNVLPVTGGTRSTIVGFYTGISPFNWREDFPPPLIDKATL